MDDATAKQLIELIKAQSNVKIGEGVISGNTLSIDGVSGEIVGKCQGDNVLLRREDGQWYGFINSGEQETQVLSTKTIRNYKRQAPYKRQVPDVICFLIDVSNSIEMDGVNRCLTILNNQLEGQFKRLTNQKIIILPFADSVYTPNTIFGNTLTRQKAIDHLTAIVTGYDSLEDKFDRYDPSVFIYGSFGISESDPNKDTLLNAYKSFWINEGTDLPENGIDAIISVLNSLSADRVDKYLYVITDNNKYSRNENDVSLILNAKFNKLYFDIIEPINSLSEQIVNEGEESNPYCSNSVATRVKVNEEIKGDYLPNSNILIKTNDTFIWEGGGEGKYHIISNIGTGEEKSFVFPKRNTDFHITGRYRHNLGAWIEIDLLCNRSKPFIGINVTYSDKIAYTNSGNSWTMIYSGSGNVFMDIFAIFGDFNYVSGFFVPSVFTKLYSPSLNMVSGSRVDLIIDDINTDKWEVLINDDNNQFYYDMTVPHTVSLIPSTRGNLFEQKVNKHLQQNLVTKSTIKRLFITEPPEEKGFENYEHIFVIQQEDVVKSLCLPQQIPLELPPSNLYQSTLISDKIFFQ